MSRNTNDDDAPRGDIWAMFHGGAGTSTKDPETVDHTDDDTADFDLGDPAPLAVPDDSRDLAYLGPDDPEPAGDVADSTNSPAPEPSEHTDLPDGDTDSPYTDPVARDIAATQLASDAEEQHQQRVNNYVAEHLAQTEAKQRIAAADAIKRGGNGWQRIDILDAFTNGVTIPAPSMLTRTDGASLIYPGKTHTIYGTDGTGKTWVATYLALETARAGQNVLYIDFEDTLVGFVSRLRNLGATADDVARIDYRNPDRPPFDEPEWPALCAGSHALVVIDGTNLSIQRIGAEYTNTTDVNRWFSDLVIPLTRNGAAELHTDHQVKDKSSRGRFPIGSQAKMSNISGAAYSLVSVPGKPCKPGQRGELTLINTKDRQGEIKRHLTGFDVDGSAPAAHIVLDSTTPDKVDLTIHPPTPGAISAAAGRDHKLLARITEVIEGETARAAMSHVPAPTFTGRYLRSHSSLPWDYKAIGDALKTLVADGYLDHISDRRGYTLIKVYTEKPAT